MYISFTSQTFHMYLLLCLFNTYLKTEKFPESMPYERFIDVTEYKLYA
jgi:hypothetical protein